MSNGNGSMPRTLDLARLLEGDLVVVDCYTPESERAMPTCVLAQTASDYAGRARVVRLNIAEAADWCTRAGIDGPRIALFEHGILVDSFLIASGAGPASADICAMLDRRLAVANDDDCANGACQI